MVAVIVVIYAAFLYLFAGGEAEKIKTAQKYLTYVAVAIAVALLSKTFVFIIEELFSSNLTPRYIQSLP